jgi:hypothetical protein
VSYLRLRLRRIEDVPVFLLTLVFIMASPFFKKYL